MSEPLIVITQLSLTVFVITSMLAMGLSLTIHDILSQLKNVRLVVLALIASFIIVPILGFAILYFIPMDDGLKIGIIILATAGGAPFLPKLAEAAKGNIAYSVGLMVLLTVVTVIYMPLVLPLLIQGVDVDGGAIARSLILLMLLPLGLGLLIKARYEKSADSLEPHISQTSTMALILLLVGGLVVAWDDIVGVIGTGAIIASILFVTGSILVGILSGGSDKGTRIVQGLGTGQRNIAAAILVAGTNFSDDPNVLSMILVTALFGEIVLFAVAGERARRQK